MTVACPYCRHDLSRRMADLHTGEPMTPEPNSFGVCICGQIVVYTADLSVRLPTPQEARLALDQNPWLAQLIVQLRGRRALQSPN